MRPLGTASVRGASAAAGGGDFGSLMSTPAVRREVAVGKRSKAGRSAFLRDLWESRLMFRRRLRACGWCLMGSLALAGQGHAEPQDEAEPEAPAAPPRAPSLIARIGVEPLSTLLGAPQLSERLRAIQRLAGLGTAAAWQRLLRYALERKAQLGARECLTLARALEPHAADGETQVVLAL